MLSNFENELQGRNLSTSTVEGYLKDLQEFINWYEADEKEIYAPEFITSRDIRKFKEHLQTFRNLKPATVNRKLASISVYFGWLEKQKVVIESPVNKSHWLDLPDLSPKYLDRRQQLNLYRAMNNDLNLSRVRYPKRWVSHQRNVSYIKFMLNTGLRLQESLDLKDGDINLSDRSGNVIVRYGKGGKHRTIPLNATARSALKDWFAVRPEGNTFIWTATENKGDKALSARAVQKFFEYYANMAGVDEFTPHVARATFAKNLLESDKGIGIEKVAALLGHASINTTRVYVAPSENDLKEAVDAISDF